MNATPVEGRYTYDLRDMFVGGPLSVYRPFREYSESVAIGAPHHATARNGEEIYERLGGELETILREIHDRPTCSA